MVRESLYPLPTARRVSAPARGTPVLICRRLCFAAAAQPLHERFSDAVEFGDFEPPMYCGGEGSVALLVASGEVECDFDEPIYRSLGHLGDSASGAADVEDLEATAPHVAAASAVEAEWMRSMPPLVKRQRAFKF